jgi:hypothetical protein
MKLQKKNAMAEQSHEPMHDKEYCHYLEWKTCRKPRHLKKLEKKVEAGQTNFGVREREIVAEMIEAELPGLCGYYI